MSTEQDIGRILQAVEDLKDGMKRIEIGFNARLNKTDEKVLETQIQQSRYRGILLVLGAMIPILIGVAKLIWG